MKARIDSTNLKDERGFTIIMALLALLMLTSFAVLIFTLTTKDLRTSVRATGEKICRSAAEAGVEKLLLQASNSFAAMSGYSVLDAYTTSKTMVDGYSSYTISQGANHVGTLFVDIPGSSQGLIQNYISAKTITGSDSRFTGEVDIEVAVTYPVIGAGGTTYQ